MLRYVVIFSVIGAFVASINPGPQYPPTKGQVWPKPQYKTSNITYYTFNPSGFTIKETGQKCQILTNAIERNSFIVRDLYRIAKRDERKSLKRRHICGFGGRCKRSQYDNNIGTLKELVIDLAQPCEEYPYFDMDESYNLTISTTSILSSKSIWGILRGLETWTQLFYLPDAENEVRINTTHIIDYPQYSHRGLLLDTSRHYISLGNILKTLDAMSMNKMNVFHWHIVDDQSFPYQSNKFPDLSRLGAYRPSMVYTDENIRLIVNYARDRGIRVIPEFDVPGHTRSWGEAYPNILTKCYDSEGNMIGLGPMNPIHNVTYKLLQDLIQEVQGLFPDKYFHVGGDEVEMQCWRSNPEVQEYMKQNNFTSISKLHALFMQNVIPLLGQRSKPIVWQEVFDENVPLSKDTLIQVWKWTPISEMISILLAGHRLIFSSSWYLDHLKTGGDWVDFYLADPRQMIFNSSSFHLENIVGGEACMWGEVVNDINVISRVWPRASAVAERLWSAQINYQYVYRGIVPDETRSRLEEHTCRMNRRGINAQPPNGPGFCVGAA